MFGKLQPLLIQNQEAPALRKVRLKDVIELTKALPDGMAKTYATFGPIAILYSPGFWLIAPVLTGGIISVSDKIFEILAERYPDNELIKTIAKLSKGTNEIVINFFEDFGFTYSLMTTIAAQIGGIKYYSNAFAKIIAPIVSFIPASLVRYARYRHANNQENGLALDVFAGTMQGANAPTFTTNLLQLQGIIPKVSPIPSAVIATSGTIGFFSGLTRDSMPRLSLILGSIIGGMEDLSLGCALLDFPNDIFAAANDDEIPNAFFYTTLVIALLYALGAMCYRGYETRQKYLKLSDQEPLDFVDDIEAGPYQDSDAAGFTSFDGDSEASDDGELVEGLGSKPELIRALQPLSPSNNQASFFYSSSSESSDHEDHEPVAQSPADSPNHQIVFFERSPSTESFFDPEKPKKPGHHRSASLT